MLLIDHSLEEVLMSRDTVILFLQHLGFVINWKKSVLTPVQERILWARQESLGQTINSVSLELSLNKIKIQKVVSECQKLLNNPQTLILELTGLIGLSASIQEVLPARLNCRFPPNKINMIFIGKRFLIYTRQRAMKSQQVGWEDVVFSGN